MQLSAFFLLYTLHIFEMHRKMHVNYAKSYIIHRMIVVCKVPLGLKTYVKLWLLTLIPHFQKKYCTLTLAYMGTPIHPYGNIWVYVDVSEHHRSPTLIVKVIGVPLP